MNWRLGILLTGLILANCSAEPQLAKPDGAQPVRIDHVILGTSDLVVGMATLEALTGVRPVLGGEHPGRGTRNALLSLGAGTYLELLAPNPNESVASADVAELKALDSLEPLGWAVGVEDVADVRSDLAKRGLALTNTEPGSRRRSDGSVIEWETFGFEDLENPLAPFFIHWKQALLHPARTSPGGCKLISLKLFEPDPQALAAAIRPLRLGARVKKGRKQAMEVDLDCPSGRVKLR